MKIATKGFSLLMGALVLLSLFSLVATVHVAAAQPGAGTWNITTVDSAGNVGMFTSIALDPHGYPHISYLDNINEALKYAYQDASGWHITTVDSGGIAGTTSLALDSLGHPHISYSGVGTLKYTYQDASGGWNITTVDSGLQNIDDTSLALNASGSPHISYSDSLDGTLKYAYQDASGGWHNTTVDSLGEYSISGASLALNASGSPHISYSDSLDGTLKYAYQDASGTWHNTTVDSGGVGQFTSIALDGNGLPHISYCGNNALKYASQDASGGWNLTTVDSAGNVGWYTSLALDSNGYPHISYWDYTNNALKYAYQDASGGWLNTTVDTGGVGAFTSIALDGNGFPHISYWDLTHEALKCAYWMPLTLTASASPTTAVANQNFTINGTLSAGANGISNATITLQNSTDNANWNNVTTNVTDTNGNYQFSNNESAANTYYYRTTYPGNATCTNATSNVVNVTVKTPTALNATAPATAHATQNFTVRGQLTAGGTGLRYKSVTLYRWNGTAWLYTGKKATTNGTGWYAISRNETVAGAFSYRTTYAGNSTCTNATSAAFNVTVTTMPTSLNLTASPTNVTVDQNFVLRGRLTAGGNGLAKQTIDLYAWNGFTWIDITATAKTNSTGWYSFTGWEPNPGTYVLLTKFLGSPTYSSSTAPRYAKVVVNATTGAAASSRPVTPLSQAPSSSRTP